MSQVLAHIQVEVSQIAIAPTPWQGIRHGVWARESLSKNRPSICVLIETEISLHSFRQVVKHKMARVRFRSASCSCAMHRSLSIKQDETSSR